MRLSSRFSPKTFEEVVGQDIPVKALSGLIQAGQRRSTLLVGTVGSGKTSLAKLYGLALNCVNPTETGSPCGRCEFCMGLMGSHLFEEYDTPRQGGEIKQVRALLERHQRAEVPAGHLRVIFFDEAHHLHHEAFDAMLKSAEDDPKLGLIFATTEGEKIPTSMRSRVWVLEVRPLPADVALPWLQNICSEVGIMVDDSALLLLIGLCEGRPRDLLNQLDQLTDLNGVQITLDIVREHFNVAHVDILPRYFMALARRDPTAISDVLSEWREPFPDKVRWIRAFLSAMYYRAVLRTAWENDPAIAAIGDKTLHEVVDAWCSAFAAEDPLDLKPQLIELMKFWGLDTIVASEAELKLRLALFHDLVFCGPAPAPVLSKLKRARPSLPSTESARYFNPLHTAMLSGSAASFGFIKAEEAIDIVDRASFLIQEHGVTFNAAVELRIVADDDEALRISDLCADGLCRTFGQGCSFAMVRTAFREQGVVVATFAFYLAELAEAGTQNSKLVELKLWVNKWTSEASIASVSASLMVPRNILRTDLRWHWSTVRQLLGGLESQVEALDATTNSYAPLRLLLGLPGSTRYITPMVGQLIAYYGNLTDDALREATTPRLGAISAAAVGAWSQLTSGWEFDEHLDRARLRTDRDRLALSLALTNSDEGTPIASLSEMLRAVPDDPFGRVRSYVGWWAR